MISQNIGIRFVLFPLNKFWNTQIPVSKLDSFQIYLKNSVWKNTVECNIADGDRYSELNLE